MKRNGYINTIDLPIYEKKALPLIQIDLEQLCERVNSFQKQNINPLLRRKAMFDKSIFMNPIPKKAESVTLPGTLSLVYSRRDRRTHMDNVKHFKTLIERMNNDMKNARQKLEKEKNLFRMRWEKFNLKLDFLSHERNKAINIHELNMNKKLKALEAPLLEELKVRHFSRITFKLETKVNKLYGIRLLMMYLAEHVPGKQIDSIFLPVFRPSLSGDIVEKYDKQITSANELSSIKPEMEKEIVKYLLEKVFTEVDRLTLVLDYLQNNNYEVTELKNNIQNMCKKKFFLQQIKFGKAKKEFKVVEALNSKHKNANDEREKELETLKDLLLNIENTYVQKLFEIKEIKINRYTHRKIKENMIHDMELTSDLIFHWLVEDIRNLYHTIMISIKAYHRVAEVEDPNRMIWRIITIAKGFYETVLLYDHNKVKLAKMRTGHLLKLQQISKTLNSSS